jgi:hypothetical protein
MEGLRIKQTGRPHRLAVFNDTFSVAQTIWGAAEMVVES